MDVGRGASCAQTLDAFPVAGLLHVIMRHCTVLNGTRPCARAADYLENGVGAVGADDGGHGQLLPGDAPQGLPAAGENQGRLGY